MDTVNIWARARHEWWSRLPAWLRLRVPLRAAAETREGETALASSGESSAGGGVWDKARHGYWLRQSEQGRLSLPGRVVAAGEEDAATIVGAGGARPDKDAPYEAIARWLPAVKETPGGVIQTRNEIVFSENTMFPGQAEWTSPTRIQLRILNRSGQNFHVGYGALNDFNHKGQPDIVPSGSEWVSDLNDPRPVFIRAATAPGAWGTVESRKVA